MKIHDKETLSVAEAVAEVLESPQILEGKMKQLHALMKKGMKDPKKIAKELGLAGTKEVHDAISKLIKSEAEVQPANKDFVDLHTVDKKDDPEKERQVEGKEKDEEDVEEGNEFTKAAAKAKLDGKDEFEFDGKTYPVEIGQDAAEKILGKKESVDLEEARGGPPPLLTKRDVEKKITDNDSASYYNGWTSDGNPMQLILKRYLVKKMKKGDDYDPYFDGASLVGPGFSGKTALAGALDPKKGYKVKDLLKALKAFKEETEVEENVEIKEETFNMFFGGYGSDWHYFKQDAKKMKAKLTNVETQFGGDYYFTMDTNKSILNKLLRKYGDLELEEQAPSMSQGMSRALDQMYQLAGSLAKGSRLNKAVNKDLGGNYNSDFGKMEKAMGLVTGTFGDIIQDYKELNEIEIDPTTGKLVGAGAPKKESVELEEKVAPNLTKIVNIRREIVKVQTKIDQAIFDGDPKTVDKLGDELHKLRKKLVNFYNEDADLKEFMMNRLKPDDVRDAYGTIELKYRSSADIRDAEETLKKAGIKSRRSGDTLEVDSDSPAFRKARITSTFDSSKREKAIMKVLGESIDEAVKPEDFVKGGNAKVTKKEVDGMLSKIFVNNKLAKTAESSKAFKAGEKDAGKKKNPYKVDTADYHLYILGTQSAQAS